MAGASTSTTRPTPTQTLAEESHGSASRKDANIAVALSKPSDKKFNLAGGVVFPTEQMEKILDSARKGEQFVSLDLYDGSEDGQTVFATAGVIGPSSSSADDIGEETVVKSAGIAALRHWPVTISYFEQKDTADKAPFYVMHFVMYENGVGRTPQDRLRRFLPGRPPHPPRHAAAASPAR